MSTNKLNKKEDTKKKGLFATKMRLNSNFNLF